MSQLVRCNGCGHVGDISEFPKGRDFLQRPYIKACPMKCGNRQSPGGASLRMMPDQKHPFELVRPEVPSDADSLTKTLHQASEAS